MISPSAERQENASERARKPKATTAQFWRDETITVLDIDGVLLARENCHGLAINA
jgi:hypothetical protein